MGGKGDDVGRPSADETLLVAARRRATRLATLLVTCPFAPSTRSELEAYLAEEAVSAEQAAERVLGQPEQVLRARIAELTASAHGRAEPADDDEAEKPR